MRRVTKRGAIAAFVAAAAACGAVASPASASTVGPKDLDTSNAIFTCVLESTCTFANVTLPQATGVVASPIKGKVTRWSVNVASGSGPMRLQVLKRTDNQPGVDNDAFQAVRQTAAETVVPNSVQTFNASLKIGKGQFLGLLFPDTSQLRAFNGPGAEFLEWWPALTPNDPGEPSDGQALNHYLLFNATVKR